jgi:seryl-tRNA synthetase
MKIREIISESFDEFEVNTEEIVLKIISELIDNGHTEVNPNVITNEVVERTGTPFLLKDLVELNNSSVEIQKYVDSINPTKIKFSSDILTVNNKKTDDAKKTATVNAMANRARLR